ncbi:MAG: PAS domain S-box protein [Bacteroidales bacterium]|nr:PAS domain S-box protein [Bacteroidales bacterium]
MLKDSKIAVSPGSDRDERNFYSFFQSSPDLLFVFDEEGLIIESNKTAAEKLQYEPDELVGKSIFSLHPPEFQKEAEVFLQEILSSKRSYCPIPLISRKGELIHVETNISQGTWDGKPAIFSLSKDLTEKRIAEESAKMNEERYKLLFENINDALFVHE